MTQEKPGDVVGGQFPDTDRRVPEAFDEETPDETPVIGDRDRSKAAFFLQVVLVLSAEDGQGRLVCCRLRRANGALLTQVFQEVTNGLCITPPAAPVEPTFFEESVDRLLMQIDECQAFSTEPPVEVVQEPKPLSHSRSGIAQLRESTDK
jgi:hypothetical protein